MLRTVKIEELQPGDVLVTDLTAGSHLDHRDVLTSREMVREAMTVPTRTARTSTYDKLRDQAHRVERPHRCGRLYASVVMGTYAVVSRRKGTPVAIDRPEPNVPQESAAAVLETTEPTTPEPFSYVRSQFDHVEDGSEFYRIQIWSDERGAHTKFMNITPDQFRAIRELLANGESA